MIKDSEPLLFHIRDACTNIEQYIADVSEEDFRHNREKQDAVIREIEIIGEAVRNLPQELKDQYPQVPWNLISSMRNFLIHEYFSVDLDLVWDTVNSEVPHLKKEIDKIIGKSSGS
jgi:uncharacterized protein with HEPN domain